MNRPLSELEHAAWLLDRGISQAFVMVVRVSSATSPLTGFDSILRKALDMVQDRHPNMRCKIKDDEKPMFISEDIPQIPIRVLSRKDDNQWKEEAEKEMVEPLPFTKGPLVRAVLLSSQEKCDLLFTFCHILADATSGVHFVHNTMRIAGSLFRGITPEPEPPLPSLPSNLDLLKKDLGFEVDPLFDEDNYPESAELPGDVEISPEKRKTRVIQRILSEIEAKKLIDACRKEETSVHGAICAAFLQSFAEQIRKVKALPENESLNIGCTTPVNMRRHFSIEVGEDMGDFISHALHFQEIDENSSLWSNARRVKDSLTTELKYGRDIKATQGVGELLKSFSTPKELVEGLKDAFPPVAVTNLGRIDIPDQFGDLLVENLHFAVSINPACKNGFAAAITSFKGQITLNFLYAEPYLSEERVENMVESTMKRLKEVL